MKKIISPLLLLTAAILWGFSFVAQKATTIVPTFTLLFSRSIVAVFFLIPAVMLFDRLSKNGRSLISLKERKVGITKRELLGGTLCGAFLFAASALQQAGIANTDAGKTSFITALYVVIVPIYALLIGRKSPLNAWIGIGIAVAGFYLLCIKDGFSIAPSDLLVFACAFAFALQIMTVDMLLPTCDGVRISLVQFSAVTVFSLIAALIFELPFAFSEIIEVLPQILFLGIGSSGIAYTLQIVGQKNTEPAVASILLSLESVFGALFSAMFLHERMSLKEYIGCAVVLLAVLVSEIDVKALFKKFSKQK
ncbi:MAG: DMT family transporter [Ruminococcaceae bacterium]|nr:DMT family transporter [Oscillospiraceae bacterium]